MSEEAQFLSLEFYPSKILRNKSIPITEFDTTELHDLIRDMEVTMIEGQGIGLAAPQIGKNIRLFLMITDLDEQTIGVFINPEIISTDELDEDEEGCLSVPGVNAPVRRAKKIKLRAQDVKGVSYEFDYDEIFARCAQHEIDHLDGRLFIDRVSPARRLMVKKQLKKEGLI